MRKIVVSIATASEATDTKKIKEFNSIAVAFSKLTGKKISYEGKNVSARFSFTFSGVSVDAFATCNTENEFLSFLGFKVKASNGSKYIFTLHRWSKWQTHIEAFGKDSGIKEVQKWTSVTPETITTQFLKKQLTELIKLSKSAAVAVGDFKMFTVYCCEDDRDEEDFDENYFVKCKSASEAKRLVKRMSEYKVEEVSELQPGDEFFKNFDIDPTKIAANEPLLYDSGR